VYFYDPSAAVWRQGDSDTTKSTLSGFTGSTTTTNAFTDAFGAAWKEGAVPFGPLNVKNEGTGIIIR